MIDSHLLRLRARDEISAEEERAIRSAVSEVIDYPADKVVVRAGVELTTCTILVSGIMARFKDLKNGQRQITELHVSGDFTDLHSFTLKRLDHEVMTLSPCRVALLPHDRMRHITEEFPHLTRVYWFATNLDAAIHREWEVSLGRRTAIERMAHLFCELRTRLDIVGLVEDDRYSLPITQAELSECLGLTPIHVNRTLREIREMGFAEFRKGQVVIQDRAGLERLAGFDPSFLYLEHRTHAQR